MLRSSLGDAIRPFFDEREKNGSEADMAYSSQLPLRFEAPPSELSSELATHKKITHCAISMRQEWIEVPSEKRLLMSIDEVLALPDASSIIVRNHIDYAADCKPTELKAIIDIIIILYRNRKVTASDIKAALGDLVEFVDVLACDNPRLFEDIGDMFSAFANLNVIDFGWLCGCTSWLLLCELIFLNLIPILYLA